MLLGLIVSLSCHSHIICSSTWQVFNSDLSVYISSLKIENIVLLSLSNQHLYSSGCSGMKCSEMKMRTIYCNFYAIVLFFLLAAAASFFFALYKRADITRVIRSIADDI